MKKYSQNNLDRLISKVVSETLEDKANGIATKLNELGGMDDGHPKFGKLNLSKMSDEDIDDLMNSNVEYDDEEDDLDFESDWEQLEEGDEMCEQCGKPYAMEGEMYEEGETCECGSGNMYEDDDMGELENAPTEFDYVEEEIDFEEEEDESEIESENEEACKYHREHFGPEDERTMRFCGTNKMGLDKFKFSMNEKLHGGQKKLDKNRNGKIDSKDFEMMRKREEKEGNAFTGALANAKKSGDDEFEVDGKTYDVKESRKRKLKLTESEMIDLIERIVKEEKVKANIKVGTPKGLEKYNQVHDKDGKENNEALQATAKKMKEYLKDGSKGEYNTNPKFFPKGNGELAKMAKKAYIPSGAVEEYVDNLTAAALENIDYDDIKPNEEWVSDNIEGSSKTGNNPEWANTGESDVNKKRNKIRKDNMLAKIKRKAYNKAPQPVVNDKAGESEGDKIMAKLESIEPKKAQKINEEFDRIQKLMGYNRKTQ